MAIRITGAGVALTVGIILTTGLLIGGLFFVKGRGEQARRDEAIQIAEQNLEDQSSDEGVALNGDDSTSAEESSGEKNGVEGGTDQPSSSTNGSSSNESTQSGGSTSTSGSSSSSSSLPQTGPEDGIWLVVVGAVVYAGTLYMQSRRAAARL